MSQLGQSLAPGEVYPGITADAAVGHGQPVISGTRVPVAVVVGHLAAGDTMETVYAEYDLTPDQVRVALGCAASRGAGEQVYVVSGA